MRTLFKSLLIAVLIASLVEAPVFAAPSRALGMVLQADRARISSGDAASGATIFDGDTLSTNSRGGLRARLGETQLYLTGNSLATVREAPGGVSATLERGTAVFSSSSPEAFELRASEARVRARSAKPTYAQVTLVGPYELVLTSQRGELEVKIGDEVHAVPEATSYRVYIESAAPSPPGGGGFPVATARSYWVLLALLMIAGGTTYLIWSAVQSPSKP